jgi:bifunctional non-homologous end joining protein LigD
MPGFVPPQLATLAKQPPAGSDWLHEIKLDGYRMICKIHNRVARIYSRNNNDWTSKFRNIATALSKLSVDSAWIDGEVVSLRETGISSFQELQNILSSNDTSKIYYFAFDLPYLNGYDLRQVPLIERKKVLQEILAKAPDAMRYSSHVLGSGKEFFDQSCRMKLEGTVAKRASSGYLSGRSTAWLKVKCVLRQEMVIGGFTDPEGSRTALGALLLGVYETDGKLRYCGKVGTGFTDKMLRHLHERLKRLEHSQPPFINPPKGWEARGAHWVKPALVAEIAFTEWTNEGTLRHPSFQGLREDKNAREVMREAPAIAASPGRSDVRTRRRPKPYPRG